MNQWLRDALRCPYCFGTFTVTHGTTPVEDWEYAVLSCYCEQYPVVAGIPVIRKGILGAKGETNRSFCNSSCQASIKCLARFIDAPCAAHF
jgi:hypothetical protein